MTTPSQPVAPKAPVSETGVTGLEALVPARIRTEAPSATTAPVVRMWLAEKLSPELRQEIDRLATNTGVAYVAIMPDVHEGSAVPNGSVVATRGLIYPKMIGSDIGCGVSALRFDADAELLRRDGVLEEYLGRLYEAVPSLKQNQRNVCSDLPDACPTRELSSQTLIKAANRDGRYQLGTLGRGNHFVELQRDEHGGLWVMVHTGSRAMGQIITDYHLKNAQESPAGLKFLDLSIPVGQAYLNDMKWAVNYATESRLHILNRVADILERQLGIQPYGEKYFDCPHNFAQIEEHHSEKLVVHRKSAISAEEGSVGLIPGSMGTQSFIVRGLGNPDSLRSASHGAGRAMSRSEAFDSIGTRDLMRDMKNVHFDGRLAKELVDEAPGAYKDIREVMKAQRDLVKTTVALSPVCSYKRT